MRSVSTRTRPICCAVSTRSEAGGNDALLGYPHLLRRCSPAAIPAAAAFAENLISTLCHGDRVLQLDETTARMFERGLDRNHHSWFERTRRVGVVIGDGTIGGEARRLVADQPHAMRQKFHVVALLRLLHEFLGGNVNITAWATRPYRFEGGAQDGFDLRQDFLQLGVRLALDRHAGEIESSDSTSPCSQR